MSVCYQSRCTFAQMNQIIVTIFTSSISIVAALVSYLNYRLNKTLNVKNQLFNEKLKKYIELSRKIAEFMELLDNIWPMIYEKEPKQRESLELKELSDKANNIGLSIVFLIIESQMLAPENVIKLMTEFAEFQNLGLPNDLTTVHSKIYFEADVNIRNKGETLIKAFRDDLGVEKLNLKLAKVKYSQ